MTRSFPQLASFALALITALRGLLASAGPRPPGPAPAPQSIREGGRAGRAAGGAARPGAPFAAQTWPQPSRRAPGRRVGARTGARVGGRSGRGSRRSRRKLAEARPPRRSPGSAVHVADLDEGTWLFDQNGAALPEPGVEPEGADRRSRRSSCSGPTIASRRGWCATAIALVLIGDGDPSLQLQGLHAWPARRWPPSALAGARRIVIDERAFSPERFGPGYEEPPGPGPSYLAPSGALSLSFNTVETTVPHRRQ